MYGSGDKIWLVHYRDLEVYSGRFIRRLSSQDNIADIAEVHVYEPQETTKRIVQIKDVYPSKEAAKRKLFRAKLKRRPQHTHKLNDTTV